jgi:hypothetical protein
MDSDLTTYSDALRVGYRYIAPDADGAAGRAGRGRFAMTRAALRNTLSYIFHYLHHVCYMVCVDADGAVAMHKIIHRTTAPVFKAALAAAVRRLPGNPTLTAAQKTRIAKTLAKGDWRVMQCIVKEYKRESARGTSNVYLDLLRGIADRAAMPQGVFIFNLTDAVILRADGMNPFDAAVRAPCPAEYGRNPHIPVLSLSGRVGYDDLIIPNYDDACYVTDHPTCFAPGATAPAPRPVLETRWSHKADRAVFRGGPTGCGTAPDSNMRLRLATMDAPPALDVGIYIKKSATVKSNTIRFDPVHGLSMVNSAMSTKPRMELTEQARCKYIIHVDGNVHAYRFLQMLATGSLTLRVDSPYRGWLDADLRAGEHYVLVRADLSDLHDVLKWCRAHDGECAAIAAAGRAAAEAALTLDVVSRHIRDAMWEAAQPEPAALLVGAAAVPLVTDAVRSKTNAARCAAGFGVAAVAGSRVCAKRGTRRLSVRRRATRSATR